MPAIKDEPGAGEMTVFTADVRAAMIDTITRFLEAARDPARAWTTPRDGAERLAASLFHAMPAAGGPATAPAIGSLAATRSLRQFRQQGTGPLRLDAPLPLWTACADDHCRTMQHCVHGDAAGSTAGAAGRFAARDAEPARAPQAIATPATDNAELVSTS